MGPSATFTNEESSHPKKIDEKVATNVATNTKATTALSASPTGSPPTKSDSDPSDASSHSSIVLLPQHVIDQIAAGEVVQRPVSVVKELLENSLDAGATHIVVHVEKGGLSKMSISDNGCGIPMKDLPLLATRHATSKLKTVDDFSTLTTFGFRGEAVASTSMVSRLLSVTTRTATSSMAYTQTYQNGQPTPSSKPKPCARTVGTTILVQDLFYNVPHRQKAYQKREHEEYAKILSVVQQYAIHYPTVGFVCERTMKQGLVVDCNTAQIPAVKALLQSRETVAQQDADKEKILEATKQVLSHVLETNVMKHLMHFECSSELEASTAGESGGGSSPTTPTCSIQLQYSAQVYCTPPDYNSQSTNNKRANGNALSQGKFILFLNDRLVDLAPLKRAMEDVYADFTTGTGNLKAPKPVLVVNLRIPGTQVDVNVHPSKRQVALMFQEDIVDAVAKELRTQLEDRGHTFATAPAPVKPVIKNPYAKTMPKTSSDTLSERKVQDVLADDTTKEETTKKRKNLPTDQIETGEGSSGSDNDEAGERVGRPSKKSSDPSEISTPSKTSASRAVNGTSTSKKTKIAPSKMIRTNDAARSGAIEPFLVSTEPSRAQESNQSFPDGNTEKSREITSFRFQRRHTPECPLFSAFTPETMDLSQPGAFASAMKCNCAPDIARQTILVKQPTVRPKRVIPTACFYKSIRILRKKLNKRQCMETTKKLRQAFFVGTLSHQRSLIQCGESLVMINHTELAKELFYQLALARFGGGAVMAHLGEVGSSGGIHIQTSIEQALQLEDNLVLQGDKNNIAGGIVDSPEMLVISDTNRRLAQQAASFLLQHANMLQDYFSIRIEEIQEASGDENVDNTVDVILTGMPVLLDGHIPQPHGLPIFLLRLANQVDYSEELPCFYGICREIGNYYAMLPSNDDELNPFVQHNLFPALSYLLLPSINIPDNGHFTVMTKLSTLYKVFERC